MDTVELHQAFMWDCEHCGIENFARAIRATLSDEEIANIREKFGIEEESEDEKVLFLLAPEKVTCSGCQTEYLTQEQL